MGSITKRVHSLADGRELIYFDDADTTLPPDRAPDLRELDPRPATATMRQDVLTGEWISIAAARQNRVVMPPAALDPLAPQTATNPSEVPSLYDVAVFENRSPSFGPELPEPGDPAAALGHLDGVGLNRTSPSYGRCEVVCFSPAHEGAFGSISRSRARTVIEAWADRTAFLSSLPGVQQVFPFENRGAAIGVTLQHPHGQIYSYPYITPRTKRLLEQIDSYGPGLFDDLLASEQAGPRVLLQGEHWTAFVPFAARWPIEVHLVPHEHVPDFAATSEAQRDELSVLYLRLLRGVDALYGDPTPYIAAWHQAPVNTHREEARLHLQLTSPRRGADKLKYLAGSEAAMGAWIGDIPPETQAERLREAIARADEENPV
ncbi:galactose-1-phosphate uridylyltransferase [Gryllotalpicola ginsengisoli]|uniref:galactose-1-phosphate uridylyltransferase n=1 Tax=Gryllotalpicola ginsengisoli TaxID=444608 RepID=UPI0003B53012|nr:galactose-1-phosphate uridylyltransferase [Gryllotalpicola ginsengisoli]